MDKRKILNKLTFLCGVIGVFSGRFILGYLLDFIRSSPEETFYITNPSQGYNFVFSFSLLFGTSLALVPFLGKMLMCSRIKLGHTLVLLIIAGLTGSILFSLYMKSIHLQASTDVKQTGLEASMSLPPLYGIPLSGIFFMLIAFGMLKYWSCMKKLEVND